MLDAQKANGLDDSTPVVFTSDSGGAHYIGLPDVNRPHRGWKPPWATLIEVPVGIDKPMRQPSVAGDDVLYWLN
jgi:arylsulfatase A-like enzyme